MSDTRKQHQAAKTTIVGGQPPGNARDLATVPVGLEELLGMAAVDAVFERALLEDPRRAAESSGVELTATEQAILGALDAATLEPMIARVRPRLPEPERRAFLEQAAVAVAALLGGAATLSAAGCKVTRGRRREDEGATSMGCTMDRPEPRDPPRDRPMSGAGPETPASSADAGVKRPRPSKPRPTRGIRPRRPPHPGFDSPRTGILPDRPKKPGRR